MNVLVCTEQHFTQVGERIFCRQSTPSMFQRYREVWDEVIVLARLHHATQPPVATPPLEFAGVRVAALPDYVGLWQFWQHRRTIRDVASQTLNEADSIVLRVPGIVSTVVWSLVRREKRPFAVEVIGDPIEGFARGAIRHPLRPIVRWTAVRQLRAQCREACAAAYVTAVKLQQQYPPNPQRYHVSCSDVELPGHAIAKQPRTAFSENGVHRIVTIGTFAQMYKGQDVLLRALAQLDKQGINFQMIFVGDGTHRSEMESLARTLGISDRTKFLGELPAGEAVRAQLDSAHLFVLPSRTEGLPRALIEAMARGLPCIGTNVGGIPELLHPDDLVRANDPRELAAKLAQSMSDPARLAEMSRRNLEQAANYKESVLHARRVEFYRQVRAGTEAWKQHRQSV
jgi:glycosyltransferase involved in cell wall biosynthesis